MSKILLLLTLLFPVIFTYGQSIPATKSSIVSVRVKEYNKLIKNAKLKHLKKKSDYWTKLFSSGLGLIFLVLYFSRHHSSKSTNC